MTDTHWKFDFLFLFNFCPIPFSIPNIRKCEIHVVNEWTDLEAWSNNNLILQGLIHSKLNEYHIFWGEMVVYTAHYKLHTFIYSKLILRFSFNFFSFFFVGIVVGFGATMVRESSAVMIGHYFKRRRQFVEMITMSGEGVGIALFSVILKEGVG